MEKKRWIVTAGPGEDSLRYIGVVMAETHEQASVIAEMWVDDADPEAPISSGDIIVIQDFPFLPAS
jgi:hypothetical protein